MSQEACDPIFKSVSEETNLKRVLDLLGHQRLVFSGSPFYLAILAVLFL